MKIKVELSGGLELLFKKQKEFVIELKKGNGNYSIQDVVNEMKGIISEKPELFISGNDNKIKPGIIVMYNDTDWEIYDKENTPVNDNDSIAFISTLHGG